MLYETYKKGNYEVIKFNEVLTFNSDLDELTDIVNDLLKKNIVNMLFILKTVHIFIQ